MENERMKSEDDRKKPLAPWIARSFSDGSQCRFFMDDNGAQQPLKSGFGAVATA